MPNPLDRVRFRALAGQVLAVAALAAAAAPALAQEVRYTRPLEVTETGWSRVPLASQVVRRSGAGGGVRLFGPEGEEVPFARLPAPAPPVRRRAEPLPAEPAEDGWWLPLDLAPGPRFHELLVFTLEEPRSVDSPTPVRLEGSADGEDWQLLAAGEVSGSRDALTLAYPATELRRLRLHWPRRPGAAGPPALAAAAVEEVPEGAFGVSLARPDCRPTEASDGQPRTVCRLRLGGTGRYLRRLCFTVSSEGAGGYRLFTAVEGRWETLAEAAWAMAPEDTPRCAPVDLALAGEIEPLRLELYGGGDEAPGVRDATAGFAQEMLLFEARRAGPYTLAYGPGVFRSTREGDVEPPGDSAVAAATLVVPGPEAASEVPAAALALPTAAGPAPAVAFEGRWNLAAEDPEPGQLHRLVLPAAVYAATEAELADLRLLVEGAGADLQVPYVLWRPDEPALVVERRGATPARGRGDDGTSRVRMEPPEPGMPLSALVVSAAPPDGRGTAEGAWQRRVRMRDPAAGDEAGGEAGPWIDWPCPPRPPLPCRVTVPLEVAAAGALWVEIEDGGAAPLPAVDVELWRRRDVLLFPWPAEGTTPVLAVGAESLAAPEFDLSERAEELVARPWREASLAVEGGGGRLGAVAITLALLAAAATLLVLLHRILAEQDQGHA